jgi:hypothetical protein
MEFKDQELVELTLPEIAAVTGAGVPDNNPPGVTAALADNEPINNPVGL